MTSTRSTATRFYIVACLVLSLSAIVSGDAVPDTYTADGSITLIENIHNLGFSVDQSLLAVLEDQANGYFYTYNGVTYGAKAKIDITDDTFPQVTPYSFAFSPNNDLLAVGTKEGGLYGFKIDTNTKQLVQPQAYFYRISDASNEEQINSIDIAKDGNIAIGSKTGVRVLSVPTTDSELEDQEELTQIVFIPINNTDVYSVDFSPLDNDLVLVGGVGEQEGLFNIYKVSDGSLAQTINDKKTVSAIYSADGAWIAQGGSGFDIDILQNSGNFTVLQTLANTDGAKELTIAADNRQFGAEIAATGSEMVVAWKVAGTPDQKPTKNKLNLLNNVISDQSQNDLQAVTFTQSLSQGGVNLALAQTGNAMLVLTSATSSTIPKFSLCSSTQFIDTDANECGTCSTDCKSCFGAADVCTSCNDGSFLNGNVCAACNTNIPGCLTCNADGSACLTCDDTSNWAPTPDAQGLCTCAATYYKNDQSVCALCSDALLDCSECSDENTCTACKDEGNFNPIPDDTTKKCVCNTGYTVKDQLCAECSTLIENCADCSDETTCTTCATGFYVNAGVCATCSEAIPGCLTCNTDGTACLTCNETADWNAQPDAQGLCTCKTTFFKNDQNVCALCEEAILDCSTCDDAQTCTACKDEGNFNPVPDATSGLCVCNVGFAIKDQQCQACSVLIDDCLECSDESTCTKCNDQGNFDPTPAQNGSCVCEPKYWYNTNQCDQCATSIEDCDTCNNEGTECDTCLSEHKVPSGDKSQCICEDFYYEDAQKVCNLCDDNQICRTCEEPGKCLKCNTEKNWQQDPVNQTCMCEEGYFDKTVECILCEVKGCAKCEEEDTCFSCSEHKGFAPVPIDNNKCECKTENYINGDGTECLSCEAVISGCVNCDVATTCIGCSAEKNFVEQPNAEGRCDCQETYFLQDANCKLCSSQIEYCSVCGYKEGTTEVICNKCSDDSFKISDEGKCVCGEDEEINSEGKCEPNGGLSPLAIIAIIVGILAVAVAAVAIVKCCKKKRSPLEDDEYEALESGK